MRLLRKRFLHKKKSKGDKEIPINRVDDIAIRYYKQFKDDSPDDDSRRK